MSLKWADWDASFSLIFALDFRFFFAYAGKRERGPAMGKTDETGGTTLSPARPWRLPARGLAVFHGPGDVARLSHYFLPRLLMQGQRVLFLDGANSADPRLIARFARERHVPFAQFNQQIEIARAFTCFQLTELIARVPQFLEGFPAEALIVTAFPDLYFDEDVRDWDARVAFEQALANLRRWAESLPWVTNGAAKSFARQGRALAMPRAREFDVRRPSDPEAIPTPAAKAAQEEGLPSARLKACPDASGLRPLAVAVFSAAETFAPPAARRRFFERVRATATEVWAFRAGDGQRLGLTCESGRPRLGRRAALQGGMRG